LTESDEKLGLGLVRNEHVVGLNL